MTKESDKELEICEHRFHKTANPLYVWEAINLSFTNSRPIPEWCFPYLRDAAAQINALRRKVIERQGQKKDCEKAYTKVREILGFGRQGQKNAFAAAYEDDVDLRLYVRSEGEAKLTALRAKELGVKKADAFISADGGLRIYMKSGSKTPNESRLNKLGLQKVSVKGVAVNLAGRQTFGDERARARKRRGKKLSGPAG